MGALCGICETDEGAFDSLFELLGGEEGRGGGEREEFADEGIAVRCWRFEDWWCVWLDGIELNSLKAINSRLNKSFDGAIDD